MAINVTKLLPYKAGDYPTLPNGNATFFTTQLRNIANAIKSAQDMLKAAALGATEISGVPTTSVVAEGTSGLFKDTSGGGVYLAYNDAGTIKKVQLI